MPQDTRSSLTDRFLFEEDNAFDLERRDRRSSCRILQTPCLTALHIQDSHRLAYVIEARDSSFVIMDGHTDWNGQIN